MMNWSKHVCFVSKIKSTHNSTDCESLYIKALRGSRHVMAVVIMVTSITEHLVVGFKP